MANKLLNYCKSNDTSQIILPVIKTASRASPVTLRDNSQRMHKLLNLSKIYLPSKQPKFMGNRIASDLVIRKESKIEHDLKRKRDSTDSTLNLNFNNNKNMQEEEDVDNYIKSIYDEELKPTVHEDDEDYNYLYDDIERLNKQIECMINENNYQINTDLIFNYRDITEKGKRKKTEALKRKQSLKRLYKYKKTNMMELVSKVIAIIIS